MACCRHWALVVLVATEERSLQTHEMRKEVEAACYWKMEEVEEAGCPVGGPWMGGCQGEPVVGGRLLDQELGEEEGG